MKVSKTATSLVLLLVLTLAIPTGVFAEQNSKNQALYNLKARFSGVSTITEGQLISRVYGNQFGYGTSPQNTAEQFRLNYTDIFGVAAENLRPLGNLFDNRHIQPLMYNRETGEYKFTLVYYSQYSGEIPVFRSELRLLIRNESNYPLVLASSSLRDLGDFQSGGNYSISSALAENSARTFEPELNNFTEPKLVIWAGINDEIIDQPRVAMEIIADNGLNATLDFKKWLLLVDIQTGEILYSENMIINVDVSGNVSGLATQGNAADICDEEVVTPMPYARVNIGGTFAFADTLGNFVIPNDDSLEVTLTSYIWGQWFRVYNQSGSNTVIDTSVFPPGPIEILHNPTNANEFKRAEVNGYIQANVVRDFTIKYNPDYPGLMQNSFPVNVNLADVCNAFYDYSSINFFSSGGGCSNTAFSTVIHHEYGHHLVNLAGSGQGQYGEGMGDVMGVLITEDPGLAYGFFNNCNQYMRTADNSYQYPCSGEIHDCGQLISGCVWDIREALMETYPDDYMDIISNLAVNAMLLHNGDMITPSIAVDYLTLDDSDGNIGNGTPHYPEICTGFSLHNMDCPELQLLGFDYPDGQPDFINPDGGAVVNIEVYGITETPQPGTGIFHYNIGSGWVELPMNIISPNIYEAVFPAAECGIEIRYYFSAETYHGVDVTDPFMAPATTYSTYSAYGFITDFEDNFETDQGWTVENSPYLTDGPWDRGIPVGNGERGDPPTDFDGSGQCYLTDNAPNNSDVDGGTTYLLSPAFDLSDGSYLMEYAFWYTNYAGDNPYADYFKVWLSTDNGISWELTQSFGPNSESGWHTQKFAVDSYITPTDQVKIRFEAADLGGGSVIEAGVDAFRLVKINCEPVDISEHENIADIPSSYQLIGSYPNPFNASTTISYGLPAASDVTLDIFNILGQKVATLVNGQQPAGYYQIIWNAQNQATGMYFYRLKADNFSQTNKMLMLK